MVPMTLGSWRYYDHEVGVEDYFLAHGEEPGVWEAPTTSTGWQVRDVIGHLVDVTEAYFEAFDAARGGPAVPEAYGLMGMGARLNEKAQAFRSVRRGGTARPFLMSMWRWPRIGRSTVTNSAEQLAARARSITDWLKPRSRNT